MLRPNMPRPAQTLARREAAMKSYIRARSGHDDDMIERHA
jgi:hypothetical protein